MNHEATKPVRVTAFAQARECKSPSAPGEVFVKVLSDRGSTPLISTRINSPPARWAVCFDRSGELNPRALGGMRNTVDYAGRQGIKSEFAEELFMERKLTEKEKLLLGESFNPEGKELINQRTIAHGLCAEYNAASELDEARRIDILNCLLGELGRDAFIQGPIQLDYGFRTFIGDRTYINFRVIGKNLGFLRFLDIIFLCQSTTPPLAPAQQGRTMQHAQPPAASSRLIHWPILTCIFTGF